MKLLLVDHATTVTGAQRAFLDLVCGLPPSVAPTVMCPKGALRDLARDLGVRVVPSVTVPYPQRLHARRTVQATREICVGAVAVRRAAAATGADVVHANSIAASVAAAYARRLGSPPIVAHVHHALGATLASKVALRAIASSADAIIANSEYTRTSIDAAGARQHVYALHSPIDRSKFHAAGLTREDARNTLGLDRRAALVGLIAEITPSKGQETAIKAMERVRARHPQARLLLVGGVTNAEAGGYDNVSYERWLYRLVRGLGLQECVEFWGARNDIPIVLCALDMVVAPSWEEPLGRSVLEAMSLGTAVIATDVGAPAEYVTHGVDGLLVAPRDVAAWSAAIECLLGDAALRKDVGKRAREAVAARFDRDAYVANVIRIYDHILADQAGPEQARR